MIIIKSRYFIPFTMVSSLFVHPLYAQSEIPSYEKIQSSYSINYGHLKNLYVSFFYSEDEANKNEFLIDTNKQTEDEKISAKEPLGYDIKLQTMMPHSEIKIGDIELENKDKVDE